MEINVREANKETGFWHTEINEADVWFDTSGIGWDIEYVARFEALRSRLYGTLICAWDSEYDEMRVICTGASDCWPAAIAQCWKPADVQACLAFAKKYDLETIIRERGQTVAGQSISNGVLIIDTFG